MNSRIAGLLILTIVSAGLCSCDPAKVIRIYNESVDDLDISIDEQSCDFLKERVLLNMDTTRFVDLSEVTKEFERDILSGIGGWQEDEKPLIRDCLSSVIIDPSGSKVNLNNYEVLLRTRGFGDRVMEVKIYDSMP